MLIRGVEGVCLQRWGSRVLQRACWWLGFSQMIVFAEMSSTGRQESRRRIRIAEWASGAGKVRPRIEGRGSVDLINLTLLLT